MRVYALWYGGCSYAFGDFADVETFDSMQALKDAFESRCYGGSFRRQNFTFADGRTQSVFTPAVDGSSTEMHVFYAMPEEGDMYPDRIVKFGPRGGIRVEHV